MAASARPGTERAAPPPSTWLLLLLPERWSAPRRHPRLAAAVTGLLLSAAFAITYGQDPLYSGNQPTYLLKAYAEAGHGFLADDWLANTADRMPAVTFLVKLTLEHPGEGMLHVYQAVLIAIYGFALFGLGAYAMRDRTRGRLWLFLALLFAVHINGGWNPLTNGFAGQAPALQVFEPALFGALLVLSLLLFVRRRHLPAVLCLAIAATAHPTYLLPAGLMAAMYALVTSRSDGRHLLAGGELGLYALLAAPIAVYSLTTFRPQSPALHDRAGAILTERIPYHADPAAWVAPEDVLRIALIVAAIVLVRRTRLAPVLAGLFVVGAALTAAQVVLGSRDLGLLFPWRVSVVLVPVATAVVAARAVELLRGRDHVMAVIGASVVAIITAARVPSLAGALGAKESYAEPVSAYVASHTRRGDVYLVPVGTRLKQIEEWASFRLRTGAPIYVDLKSHPLRDREVIEWWTRVQTARQAYRSGFPSCEVLESLHRTAGVTAVVVPTQAVPPAGCRELRLAYRDPYWSLYRLT